MSKEKRFTIAVLTGTWLPWWSNAALGWGTQTWYGMASIALGGVMPTVVTLWLLHREAMSEKNCSGIVYGKYNVFDAPTGCFCRVYPC